MKASTYDARGLDQAVAVLDGLHQHRVAHPLNPSDALYYELLAKYYRGIRDAHDAGKKLVYHTDMMPVEIFRAMDIVPCHDESVAMVLNFLFDTSHEGFDAAKAYGLGAELCSVQRVLIGHALLGWMPRPDAVISANISCDIMAKKSQHLSRFWDCPGFYLDRGYEDNQRELDYFVRELEGMVAFLEEVSGHKMDWDRLVQATEHARQLMIYQREIEELRKAIPCPVRNRAGVYLLMAGSLLSGTADATNFFRQIRDEAKARVERGEGFVKEEKYRLLVYHPVPSYGWKLLDWMERAHGAVVVDEPATHRWGPGDFDPSKPLEALAYRTFIRPAVRQHQGPIEPLVEDMVRAVTDYHADGVLSFSHVGCQMSTSPNRLLKDRIGEETGVPFFAVEVDYADPAFVSEEQIRDKIEGFLEMIDERRG